MANLLMDTVDLEIFDGEGKLITKVNHNMKAVLDLNGLFSIQMALLDLDLLASFGEKESVDNVSDFDKAIKGNKKKISFSKNRRLSNKYKILAKGILYDAETNAVSHDFDLVIHSAKLNSREPLSIEARNGRSFNPVYVFDLEETKDGLYVDLETVKR